MKIYIAGKISGDPQYREKFRTVEKQLQGCGHIVLNPATLPEGMTREDYMTICFAMMQVADGVFCLPDTGESGGASVEVQWCVYVGKKMWGAVDAIEEGEIDA